MNELGVNSGSRESGILMPFNALPGPDYRGTFGDDAHRFLDFARNAGFSIVHDLPFSPPDPFESPYSSDSAFAIDPMRINLFQLIEAGDIQSSDLDEYFRLVQTGDMGQAIRDEKAALLKRAALHFADNGPAERQAAFADWYEREARWADSFAAYGILKNLPENVVEDNWRWQYWQTGKDDSPELIEKVKAAHPEDFYATLYSQWTVEQQQLEYIEEAKRRDLQIWGDVPFYAGHGEVWANRHLFNLRPDGFQINQGGADKSVTSETGQMWGFATYKADRIEDGTAIDEQKIEALVDWWIDRLLRAYKLCHGQVRLDHFIGWAEPYIIAADAENGLGGYRDLGIGKYILKGLQNRFGTDLHLHFYPEDLGTQTEATPKLRDEFGLFANTLAVRGFTKCLRNGAYRESIHNPQNYAVGSASFSTNHDMSTLPATMDMIRSVDPQAFASYIAYVNEISPYEHITRESSSARLARYVIEQIMHSKSTYAFVWVGDALEAGGEWQYNLPNTVLPSNWSKRLDSNDVAKLNGQAPYYYDLNDVSNRLKQNVIFADEFTLTSAAAD